MTNGHLQWPVQRLTIHGVGEEAGGQSISGPCPLGESDTGGHTPPGPSVTGPLGFSVDGGQSGIPPSGIPGPTIGPSLTGGNWILPVVVSVNGPSLTGGRKKLSKPLSTVASDTCSDSAFTVSSITKHAINTNLILLQQLRVFLKYCIETHAQPEIGRSTQFCYLILLAKFLHFVVSAEGMFSM